MIEEAVEINENQNEDKNIDLINEFIKNTCENKISCQKRYKVVFENQPSSYIFNSIDLNLPGPLTTYMINHNLNSELIDYSIWIKDEETCTWHNDHALLTIIDKNNIKISLSVASHVRVILTKFNNDYSSTIYSYKICEVK